MRNTNRNKVFFLWIAAILIAGCETWTKAGGPYFNNSALYRVDLPWGWMRYSGKDLIITRDGILLEDIVIKRVNINKKLEHTKKKFVKGMLPEDIAEVEIDDIISNPEINNFKLLKNIPADINGQSCFMVVYNFCNKDGLKYKRIHYGFGYEDWVYSLVYAAPTDHYFGKNLEEFNKVMQSFKFLANNSEEKTTPLYTLAEDDIVKKVAIETEAEEPKVEPEEEPQQEESAVMSAQPRIATYAEYYRFLHKTISGAVVKPEGSGSGTINATFTLLSDGTIEDVKILDGSAEDTALREAVVKAIKDSAPFPAFPRDMKRKKEETFTITLEFRYRNP